MAVSADQSKKKAQRKIGFAHDNFMLLHENHKRYHPERPSRLMSIYTYLEESETKLLNKCMMLKCPFSKLKHIEKVHTKEMIDAVEKSRYQKHKLRDEGIKELKQHGKDVNYLEYDVYANRYTYEAALMAAGACIEACKAIFKRDDVDSAYAAVRPPGHHADECKS
jgi:acetoin utilization deacetylase AcuC-like enzyme